MRSLVSLVALACLCTATPAQAQGAPRDAAFERRIEARLAAIAPGALTTFQAATSNSTRR